MQDTRPQTLGDLEGVPHAERSGSRGYGGVDKMKDLGHRRHEGHKVCSRNILKSTNV